MIEAAQFGVHRSPSRSAARPFVVVLQSNDFHRMATRVVASLMVQEAFARIEGEHPRVAPTFIVQGRGYALNAFDIAAVNVGRLGKPVASFASDDNAKRRIQDALDTVLKPF